MSDIDSKVAEAYQAWDLCHMEIGEHRVVYDRALARHMKGESADPMELRDRIKDVQVRCDQLFFAFLKAAEARTRERYI